MPSRYFQSQKSKILRRLLAQQVAWPQELRGGCGGDRPECEHCSHENLLNGPDLEGERGRKREDRQSWSNLEWRTGVGELGWPIPEALRGWLLQWERQREKEELEAGLPLLEAIAKSCSEVVAE